MTKIHKFNFSQIKNHRMVFIQNKDKDKNTNYCKWINIFINNKIPIQVIRITKLKQMERIYNAQDYIRKLINTQCKDMSYSEKVKKYHKTLFLIPQFNSNTDFNEFMVYIANYSRLANTTTIIYNCCDNYKICPEGFANIDYFMSDNIEHFNYVCNELIRTLMIFYECLEENIFYSASEKLQKQKIYKNKILKLLKIQKKIANNNIDYLIDVKYIMMREDKRSKIKKMIYPI